MTVSLMNISCDKDEEIRIVHDTVFVKQQQPSENKEVVNADNNQTEPPIEVTQKKISKIEISGWREYRADSVKFLYCLDGSLQTVIHFYWNHNIETQQNYEYLHDDNTGLFYSSTIMPSIQNRHPIQCSINNEHVVKMVSTEYNINSTIESTYSQDGYLTGLKFEHKNNLDNTTYQYTYDMECDKGLATKTKLKIESHKSEESSFVVNYSDIKNNLNIDIFYLICYDALGFNRFDDECNLDNNDIIMVGPLFKLFGSKMQYLPSKIEEQTSTTEKKTNDTEPTTKESKHTYSLYYSFDGDALSRIVVTNENGSCSVFKMFYE